jgi:predicted dienelactone hydrolase
VMSHGSGSAYFAHYDTALALAQAGFVVVAHDTPRRQQSRRKQVY